MRTARLESMVTPPEALQVAAWVRLARSGDLTAYERLYRAHSGRIFALCLRLSGDRGMAAELTQDVFVHAWRKLRLLDTDAAFSTWLFRVAVNLVLMTLRRQKARSSREAGSDALELAEPVRGRGGDPAIARIDLERAIARLPEQARAVFVLHDVEGYRHEEIANQMNIAVGTSKAQLHRARRLLREVLDR